MTWSEAFRPAPARTGAGGARRSNRPKRRRKRPDAHIWSRPTHGEPQVNGVVHTLERMSAAARDGCKSEFILPDALQDLPCRCRPIPTFVWRWPRPGKWRERIDAAGADHIHIATEGPIGWAARRYCRKRGKLFTTSYHTRFPEYIAARTRLPEAFDLRALRRFHAPAAATLAPTTSIKNELTQRGFDRVKVWTRGVDHALFRPRPARRARLAASDLSQRRPHRRRKEPRSAARTEAARIGRHRRRRSGARDPGSGAIPTRIFSAPCTAKRSPRIYASADVFVFPSKTDTFGIVIIEALASGLPVAAFPVAGPLDVIGESGAGVLDRRSSRRLPRRARNSARARARTLAALHLARKRAAVPPSCRSQPGDRRSARPDGLSADLSLFVSHSPHPYPIAAHRADAAVRREGRRVRQLRNSGKLDAMAAALRNARHYFLGIGRLGLVVALGLVLAGCAKRTSKAPPITSARSAAARPSGRRRRARCSFSSPRRARARAARRRGPSPATAPITRSTS